MTNSSKNSFLEIFYKTMFLIPVLVWAVAVIFLPDPGIILIGSITAFAIMMTYGSVRYGWDEEYRKNLIKYKADQKKLPKDQRDGYVLSEVNKIGMAIGIIGFVLCVILAKIFVFFNIK